MTVIRLNSQGEKIEKSDVEALVLSNGTCMDILRQTVKRLEKNRHDGQ